MPQIEQSCRICTGEKFDREFGRVLVSWGHLWRLSTSVIAPIVGSSYLEPRRHIPCITDLDGPEAATFGPTLAGVTRLIRELSGADIYAPRSHGEHRRADRERKGRPSGRRQQ
jgi:hypothetical protein